MKRILILIFILLAAEINICALNKVLTPTEKQEYNAVKHQLLTHLDAIGKNKATEQYIEQYLRDMKTPISLRLYEDMQKIGNLFLDGNNLLAAKKYNEAIQKYDDAIIIDDGYFFLFDKRAQAYAGLNNFQEAINDYSRAIKIVPHMGYFYTERSKCYYFLGNNDAAFNDIKTASSLGEPMAVQIMKAGK